jgi:periplasmic protein TonB
MRDCLATGLLLVAIATAATLRAQDAPVAAQPWTPGITPPKVVSTVDPLFNPQTLDKGHRRPFDGICMVGFTLDEKGIPQDVRVIQSLDSTLDAAAVKAVRQYRFRPAMGDGHPMAMQMKIQVAFHIH